MASIEKRGPNSYRLIVETGYNAQGKRIKKSKTVKVSTKREAEKELAKFVVEVEAGEYISPEKITFGNFVKDWEKKYAIKHLEISTVNSYKFQLKNHILPVFGHLRLDQIKPIHIVNFINDLSNDGARKDGDKGGLSSASIYYIHRVLKNIFQRATEWRIIKVNPVIGVKRPKVVQKKVNIYSEEETTKLFSYLVNEKDHWRIMITLALTTGMRRGELLALEWKNVNLEQQTILINQSLSYVNGKLIIKEPKTKGSIRKVSIPPALIPELKEYRQLCEEQKFQCGDLWSKEHFFVFSSWNGKPFYPTVPGTWLRRFIKRHGLKPIHFHALRHTSATLLINKGVHAKIIAERLGHADIRTTMNIYGQVLQSADRVAAEKFNELFIPKTIKE